MVKITILCPKCKSDDIVRHGKTAAGKQVYRCRNKKCLRSRFQLEYKNKACYPDKTEKIIKHAINGSGIGDTGRVLGISPSTVMNRLKKKGWLNAVNWKYIQEHRDPTKIRFYAVKVEAAEADEMWSYVQNKDNVCWLWHAIDHKTGDILAYTFGSAEDKVFDELFELLSPFKIQKFYTDGKKTYAKKLKHRKVKYGKKKKKKKVKRTRKIVHEVGKKNTQKIERVHLSLRTWVKRLARKTICFSKSLIMHQIVVGLCIIYN
jgi:IS1 family transposase/transposase-like protein